MWPCSAPACFNCQYCNLTQNVSRQPKGTVGIKAKLLFYMSRGKPPDKTGLKMSKQEGTTLGPQFIYEICQEVCVQLARSDLAGLAI